MPVTIRISPTANSVQSAIIPDVTEKNAGVMTPAMLALLNSGGGGSTVVKQRLLVVQADGFSKAFLWTVPFVADYDVAFAVYATGATAGVIVNIDVATKIGAGFTVLFSAPFDGQIEFLATLA